MRIADVLKLVFSNLIRLKFRVILTILGVLIGTAAVVTLVSLAAGAERRLVAELENSFGDVKQITIFGGDMGFMGPGPPPSDNENKKEAPKLNDDFVKQLQRMEGVASVLPIRNLGSLELSYKKNKANGQLQAVDSREFKKFGFKLAQGHYLSNGKKVLLGAEVAKQLYGKKFILPSKKVKASIFGDGAEASEPKDTKLKIAGVLKPKGGEVDFTVYLAEKKAKSFSRVFGLTYSKEYSSILVKANSPEDADKLTKRFKEMNLQTMSLKDMIGGMKRVFLMLYALLGGVGAIALIVAALGITNTMTMAIYERTREIGIFKALGTSNKRILQLFILEAALIGIIGGVLGVFGGYLASQIINVIIANVQNMKTLSANILYTPGWLMVFGVIFSTIIALLAGIVPAARASRLSPLKALRHE